MLYPNLTSHHRAIFQSIPLLYVCAATQLVYGNTRQAMCMLHTKQQKPVNSYLALRIFFQFLTSFFLSFAGRMRGIFTFIIPLLSLAVLPPEFTRVFFQCVIRV